MEAGRPEGGPRGKEGHEVGRTTTAALAAVLTVALALSSTGCAQIAEKAKQTAVEKATGVKVDKGSNKVTVTGKDGKQVTFAGGDGKLPPDLPKDFPVYQGTPQGSGQAQAPDGETYTFTVLTQDPVPTVYEWYKTQFSSKGWSIENSSTATVNQVSSGSLSAKKGKSEAMVTIGGDKSKGDNVSISVILNVKK